MPEMRFRIRWCDGTEELCYSPSLVVKKYFELHHTYDLEDFVQRARTALQIASDRVQAKYGYPCGLALGQLQQIEERAAQYRAVPDAQVEVLQFIE
ncbi:MAG: MSMEG_0570 family nitrogen starvation response protein [Synechococcales cyanobacterium M58_A2018_015]|nr:MSMEG_0570 family nitrogen starvation response protein [Synechococcales cyanobacterium M58_A2018_015]